MIRSKGGKKQGGPSEASPFSFKSSSLPPSARRRETEPSFQKNQKSRTSLPHYSKELPQILGLESSIERRRIIALGRDVKPGRSAPGVLPPTKTPKKHKENPTKKQKKNQKNPPKNNPKPTKNRLPQPPHKKTPPPQQHQTPKKRKKTKKQKKTTKRKRTTPQKKKKPPLRPSGPSGIGLTITQTRKLESERVRRCIFFLPC